MKKIKLTKTVIKMFDLTEEQFEEYSELEEDFEKEDFIDWEDCVWNEYDEKMVIEEIK